jgi:hypothetical protein
VVAVAGLTGTQGARSTSPQPLAGAWGLIPLLAWSPLIILVLLYPLVFGTVASWTTDFGLIAVAAALILPIVLVAQRRPAILAPLRDSIAPGDILALVHPLVLGYRWAVRWILRRGAEAGHRAVERVTPVLRGSMASLTRKTQIGLDDQLTAWPLAGTLWLGIVAGLIALTLLWPSGAGPQRAAGLSSDETDTEGRAPVEMVAPATVERLGPADAATRPEPDAEDTADRRPTEPADTATPTGFLGTDAPGADPTSLPETTAPAAVTAMSPVSPPPAPARNTDAPAPAEGPSEAAGPSARCDPEVPYRFTDGGTEGLDLIRCRRVGEDAEWVDAPPISNALLRLIQTRLNTLGFDAGSVDGFDGPATRGAIRQFQASVGMEADGTIDFSLLDQLQSNP